MRLRFITEVLCRPEKHTGSREGYLLVFAYTPDCSEYVTSDALTCH